MQSLLLIGVLNMLIVFMTFLLVMVMPDLSPKGKNVKKDGHAVLSSIAVGQGLGM